MKRSRLSTLLLLVVIAALALTLAVQRQWPTARELQLVKTLVDRQNELVKLKTEIIKCQEENLILRAEVRRKGSENTPTLRAKEGDQNE